MRSDEPAIAPRAGLLDRLAVGLSGLCVAHCLATLLLVSLLASAGSAFLADPRIHETGLGVAILLGAVALGRGVRRHGRMLPLALGGTGLLMMSAALAVSHGLAEAALTIAGVTLVATAHRLNGRPCA